MARSRRYLSEESDQGLFGRERWLNSEWMVWGLPNFFLESKNHPLAIFGCKGVGFGVLSPFSLMDNHNLVALESDSTALVDVIYQR